MGITNPALLGLAEEGALTAEALTSAGLDATAVAEGVAAVAPEVATASASAVASGISPEIIAMANATADPIAALNAAQGWTIADTAYLATIGATPELLALAETNNAALATGTTTGTTTDAGTTTGTTTGTTGSTIPVEDAVPSWVNPNPTPDPTFFQGLKDYGSAVLDSLGLGSYSATQLAAMAAAGALAPGVLSALGLGGNKGPVKPTTSGDTFTVPEVDIPDLAVGGVNPGMLPITPMYKTTNDVQGQFYWGKQPYAATYADIAKRNDIPGVPKHAWGLQEAQQPFDVSAFIANTINPGAAAAMAGAPYPSYAVAGPVTPAELQPA